MSNAFCFREVHFRQFEAVKEEAFEQTLALMRATAKRPFDALPALRGPRVGSVDAGCAGDEDRVPGGH